MAQPGFLIIGKTMQRSNSIQYFPLGCQCKSRNNNLWTFTTLLPSPFLSVQQWSGKEARRNVLKGLKLVQHFDICDTSAVQFQLSAVLYDGKRLEIKVYKPWEQTGSSPSYLSVEACKERRDERSEFICHKLHHFILNLAKHSL